MCHTVSHRHGAHERQVFLERERESSDSVPIFMRCLNGSFSFFLWRMSNTDPFSMSSVTISSSSTSWSMHTPMSRSTFGCRSLLCSQKAWRKLRRASSGGPGGSTAGRNQTSSQRTHSGSLRALRRSAHLSARRAGVLCESFSPLPAFLAVCPVSCVVCRVVCVVFREG